MPAVAEDQEFAAAVSRVIEATRGILHGETAAWKEVYSHRDDVTLCGGRGAAERGWAQLELRFDWIASTYAESRDFSYENIATVVGTDLAYTVGIERSQMRFRGRGDFVPMVLRITHVYRREDDAWKLVHRHADALAEVRYARELYPGSTTAEHGGGRRKADGKGGGPAAHRSFPPDILQLLQARRAEAIPRAPGSARQYPPQTQRYAPMASYVRPPFIACFLTLALSPVSALS